MLETTKIKNPYYDVLKSIVGESPPKFCEGIKNTSELNEADYSKLQVWCKCNAKPEWATGLSFLEATDFIVSEAFCNGNIAVDDDGDVFY